MLKEHPTIVKWATYGGRVLLVLILEPTRYVRDRERIILQRTKSSYTCAILSCLTYYIWALYLFELK